jgi:hypothetical protein
MSRGGRPIIHVHDDQNRKVAGPDMGGRFGPILVG